MPVIIEGSMSTHRTSKKTLLIFIICALAVFGTAVYANRGKINQAQSSPKKISITPSNTPIQNVTNSDWKKDFFTGSVTTKSAEAKNPTKNEPEKPLTLTDKLGREFFTRYVELKQSNLTDDQKSVQEAMNNTLAEAVDTASKPKIYTLSNIISNKDSSSNAIKIYANEVSKVFISYWPDSDPVQITNDVLEKDNMALLSKIDPIIVSYGKIVNKFLTISVPKTLASDHLNLINSISSLLYVSQGMRSLSSDPMRAIVALNEYPSAMNNMKESLINIKNYLRLSNINFSESEPGNIFSTIY